MVAEGEGCRADHRMLAGLAWAAAPFCYVGTGGALVRRFKFGACHAAGILLVRSVVGCLRARCGGEFRRAVLVPIPLHRSRRRQRGFDQARWLAEQVGARLGLRVAAGVLVRTRATLPQGDPRVTSREANVGGALQLARPAPVRGRSVILVDDVLTSGATAREAAAALRAAGAARVAVATACRA